MLITCPSCSKKYSIKAQALGAKGRTVKCKNCGHKWFQSVPGAKAAKPAPASDPTADQDGAMGSGMDDGFENAVNIPDPPPIPDQIIRNDDDERPPSKKGLIGWLVLLILLGGGAGAGVVFSQQIMAMLPQTAVLYQAIGVHVPYVGEGLDLRDLPPTRADEGGIDVLTLSAEVTNITEIERELPVVRVELLDPLQRVVQRKDIRPELTLLQPGETYTVSTKIRQPSPSATDVAFTFIDPRAVEPR